MAKGNKITDIFINYSANIRYYISRIVRPEDIEDIVQETFIKSYEADLKQEIQ